MEKNQRSEREQSNGIDNVHERDGKRENGSEKVGEKGRERKGEAERERKGGCR